MECQPAQAESLDRRFRTDLYIEAGRVSSRFLLCAAVPPDFPVGQKQNRKSLSYNWGIAKSGVPRAKYCNVFPKDAQKIRHDQHSSNRLSAEGRPTRALFETAQNSQNTQMQMEYLAEIFVSIV